MPKMFKNSTGLRCGQVSVPAPHDAYSEARSNEKIAVAPQKLDNHSSNNKMCQMVLSVP